MLGGLSCRMYRIWKEERVWLLEEGSGGYLGWEGVVSSFLDWCAFWGMYNSHMNMLHF